jgi:4-diphosphocytidyl-2-C-methyl-D-erythritol kinase
VFFIEQVVIKANAKLNLTLDIVGKRSDGYHELESLMQSVDLSDAVRIRRGNGISVSCSDVSLSGDGNLAYRAAELFFKAAGLEGGVAIDILKRIPVAAGLGGGSADAAAVLVGLEALFETGLGKNRLCEIGLELGADVPFCVLGGSMLAQGVGERLTPKPSLPQCRILISKSGEKSSTGGLYARYDRCGAESRPNTRKMLAALKKGNLEEVCYNLCNVFEKIVPESAEIKKQMLESGALGASLSGSGPSVFGIFADEKSACACLKALDNGALLCSPANCGCEILY